MRLPPQTVWTHTGWKLYLAHILRVLYIQILQYDFSICCRTLRGPRSPFWAPQAALPSHLLGRWTQSSSPSFAAPTEEIRRKNDKYATKIIPSALSESLSCHKTYLTFKQLRRAPLFPLFSRLPLYHRSCCFTCDRSLPLRALHNRISGPIREEAVAGARPMRGRGGSKSCWKTRGITQRYSCAKLQILVSSNVFYSH